MFFKKIRFWEFFVENSTEFREIFRLDVVIRWNFELPSIAYKTGKVIRMTKI